MSDNAQTPVPYAFDLRFAWDERECVRAGRALVKLQREYRSAFGVAIGAGGLVALLTLAEVTAEGLAAGGALLAMLLPVVGLGLLAPWMVLRGHPAMMALLNRRPARWSPGQRFAASEDSLLVELPGDSSLIPWSAVSKVVETDEFLFVFLREDQPVYVPKRAFRDAVQLAELRAFVAFHVAPTTALGWQTGPAALPGATGEPSEPGASGGATGDGRD